MTSHLTDKLAIILNNKQIQGGVFKTYKKANNWMLEVTNN